MNEDSSSSDAMEQNFSGSEMEEFSFDSYESPPRTPKRHFNNYWGLEVRSSRTSKPKLFELAKGFGCAGDLEDWTAPGLVAWLRRRELQLLDYDQCSDEELAAFIRQRNISILPSGLSKASHKKPADPETSLSHRELSIKALKAADRSLTFDRFVDLPPELRKEVYKVYFQDFPHDLKLPAKPPITKTCRLIRQETLPLFYANHNFFLSYEADSQTLYSKRWAYEVRTRWEWHEETRTTWEDDNPSAWNDERFVTWGYDDHTTRYRVHGTGATHLFLLHILPEHFQHLRQITMDMKGYDVFPGARVSVTLGKAAQSYRLKVKVENPSYQDLGHSLRVTLKRAMAKALDKIAARGGVMKFTNHDMYALHDALQHGWRDAYESERYEDDE